MTAPVASAQDRNVVFVRVLDLVGQPVTDLAADDFVVSEDGRRARVVSATAGTEPMRVALLIDNGESARAGHAVIALRNAVGAFLEAVPPEHPVGLFTIGGHARRMVDFTTDRAPLKAAARSLFFNQAPNLARDTGGRYASVVLATAMADVMAELATDMGVRYRDLSSRYRLVYERPDPPGSSVMVRVDRANIGLTRLFPDRRIDP